MKTNLFKNIMAFPAAILFGVMLLSSCLKNNDDYKPSTSYFSVVNSFSGNPSVDFWLDNQKASVQPLLYKEKSEYLEVYSGTRRLTVTNGGTTDIIADGNVGFSASQYYSVFLGPKSETEPNLVAGVIAVDNLTLPTSGKAKIRFVNLTPGALKMDVHIKGQTSLADTLFGNKAAASVSAFKEIDPSVTALEIREAGKSEVKLEVPVTLQANKIYTLSTSGLWAGTAGHVFAAKLTTNK
jgi:hypothetical protein